MNVEQLQSSEWFRELVQNVQVEISRHQDRTPNRRQAQLAEREALEAKSRGWIESLSKPNLDSRLRDAIETQFQQAKDRIDEISSELSEQDNLVARSEGMLDPALVVAQLNRLAEVQAVRFTRRICFFSRSKQPRIVYTESAESL